MAAHSSSSIPPSSPPAGVPPVAASSMAGQLQLTGLDVNHAPPQLDPPPAPVTLKGEVIASNPETKEVTIKTPAGDIRLTSTTPLPEGLEVSLQLYADKAKLRATIIVMRSELARHRQLAETLSPETTPAPPPAPLPLKQGQVVPAILLPKPVPAAPLPVADIARTLEQLRKSMPDMVRYLLPAPLADDVIQAPDIRRFLDALPPARLREIAAQLQQPATTPSPQPDADIPAGALTRALNAYQPHTPVRGAMPAPPLSAPPSPPDTGNALLHAQTYAPDASKQIPAATRPVPPSMPQGHITPPPPASADIAKLWEQTLSLSAPRAPQGIQPPVPQGQNMYHLTAIRILPPATPPAQIQAAVQQASAIIAPHTLQVATVDSLTPAGQPIITTPYGASYAVRAPVTADIGSTLIVTLVPMTADDIAHLQLIDTPESGKKDTFAPTPWQSLKDTFAILHQIDPAALHNLRQTLPSPSAQFTPTVLFFIAALRMGVIEKWLGDNTLRALQDAGKSTIADRLTGDFSRLSTQSKEVSADGWRSFTLPLLHEEQLTHVHMYVRQQNDGDGQHNPGHTPMTRFIVNMQLSRMGDMQLDGLLRKQKGQFDLILRTQENLPADMRHDLMQAFARGLAQANMQGGISFQTRQQSWVMVEPDRSRGNLI